MLSSIFINSHSQASDTGPEGPLVLFQIYTVVGNVKEAHECQESGETQELMLFFIFQLYTVVRNVKEAHKCHESCETQEFDDDILTTKCCFYFSAIHSGAEC